MSSGEQNNVAAPAAASGARIGVAPAATSATVRLINRAYRGLGSGAARIVERTTGLNFEETCAEIADACAESTVALGNYVGELASSEPGQYLVAGAVLIGGGFYATNMLTNRQVAILVAGAAASGAGQALTDRMVNSGLAAIAGTGVSTTMSYIFGRRYAPY
jgi:hypothetical protein